MVAAAATIAGKPLGLCTAHTSTLIGLDAHPIRVEVCATRGPAFFQLVGLAEAAVREARVRVASALAGLGVLLDEHAITVNLAPADLRKSGAALDVAIAVAVLGAIGELEPAALEAVLLVGELSLDGCLQPVRGVLPQLEGARTRGVRAAIVPSGNAAEAGLVSGLNVLLADSLQELCAYLRGGRLPRAPHTEFVPAAGSVLGDMSEVRGQSEARRALEVAAAGAHNLLMIGPPGGGKTMLARLLPSILPPLTFAEAIQATAIHSVAGLVDAAKGIIDARPFRAPHHSVSEAGLVGGGESPRPGEVSLAHNGVLFLDELAEFRRSALEALRQPLEDGGVAISRARARAWFPARPMLVAAVNPCPCGYSDHAHRACRCTDAQRLRYHSRLSGPLIDRLDIHVSVRAVEVSALGGPPGETSASVRARVIVARERQLARARGLGLGPVVNAELRGDALTRAVELDARGRRALERAVVQHNLSARVYQRLMRVARSIADVDGDERVRSRHIEEAVQGRLLDYRPLR
jgi:magnesium chelatase family protein